MSDNVVSMGHNKIDKGLVKSAVSEIEAEQARIDEIMEQAKADCQPFRDKIKEIKKQAAEEGLAKKQPES